jgi:hypothetical protein
MPGIYKDGKWYTGDNSGHMIKDNGTDLYPREALNFTDFNVQDDSVNDETDIKPHRLTQEELSEIMSKKPAPQDGFPILFDERGVERQVGWYVYSDGTKKPVYEKSMIFPYVNNGTDRQKHSLAELNIDTLIDCFGMWKRNASGNYGYMSLINAETTGAYCNTFFSAVENNVLMFALVYGASIKTMLDKALVTFHYTKTTDQPI